MENTVTDKGFAIELRKITKTFGSVVANNNIDLSVKNGEILALLGENGSGKTTLMNMLSGIYTPDSGSIYIYGKQVSFRSPKDSIKLGIGMIHQHFKLIDILTAKDNIILGTASRLNGKALTDEISNISNKFDLAIEPDKRIYDMSVGEKQNIEIFKVLFRGARILILDEPTAVLTPQETRKLFNILRKIKEQGCAVVIITHKLNEVLEISDRVTILRKGESIATVETKETNRGELIEMMVGRSIDLSIKRDYIEQKEKKLEVNELRVLNSDGRPALNNVSFELFSGEILGVAGIAGSGQKELCESIAGLEKTESGEILYYKSNSETENLVGKSPREIIKMGISMSFIPEDRLGMGLVASMDMVDNLLLKEYKNQKGIFINKKTSRKLANELIDRLEIVTPGINYPIRLLSGGNVQKVLLGREIESNPNILITAYPVRGLDINSSYVIYDLLNEQKKKGVAILYIGEDLDVLLELCDRIMVISGGNVMGIVEAAKITKEELGLMMLNAHHNDAAPNNAEKEDA